MFLFFHFSFSYFFKLWNISNDVLFLVTQWIKKWLGTWKYKTKIKTESKKDVRIWPKVKTVFLPKVTHIKEWIIILIQKIIEVIVIIVSNYFQVLFQTHGGGILEKVLLVLKSAVKWTLRRRIVNNWLRRFLFLFFLRLVVAHSLLNDS